MKVSESRPVAQYEQVSSYEMDRLRPRIDLRPRVEVPVYPQDDVDADPRFNEYPAWEEFVEGRIGCLARSLPRYVPRSTVEA